VTPDQVLAEATLLDDAETGRYQIRQSTSAYPAMTMDDAYDVQRAWLDKKLGRGQQLFGHKIGLTSRAMQAAMKITTPDSGFLTTDMVYDPNTEINAGQWCDLKLELELAFVLKTDLTGDDLTVDDVLAATNHVVPAVELIAARSFRVDPQTGRARTVHDTIADNAADAGIVCAPTTINPNTVDLRWVGALGYRNGTIEETGVAAGVLDHPALGIVWLARRYAAQGLHLEAGQTILSGSFTRPIEVRAGDEFRFDYGPFGSFELAFT